MKLTKLKKCNDDRYKWDPYFLSICNVLSKNSKCMSRQVGSILVRDKSILSTGYNGPPGGIPHCNERYKKDENIIKEMIRIHGEKYKDVIKNFNKCPRHIFGYTSGNGLEFCIAGHSERNCIVNASRNGININGSTLYLNACLPCKDCMIEIINAGIVEVVATDLKYYDEQTKFLVKYSKIEIRKFCLEEKK